jgi:integrase
MPGIMRAIGRRDGMEARALEFAILTATRRDEARCARWSELDWATATWVVPGARVKTRVEFRVPLSRPALALLAQLRRYPRGEFVFPGRDRGKPISHATVWRALRVAGFRNITLHGFRATFRSWCADHGVDRSLAESALSHLVPGIEGDYQRSDVIQLRAPLMQRWARWCTSGR